MLIEILGAHAGFAKNGMNSSFIVWKNNEKQDGILIDCGFTVFPELRRLGYIENINTVLLSHLHQDHSGSAAMLVDYKYAVLEQKMVIGGTDWDELLKVCLGTNDKNFVTEFNSRFPLEKIPTTHIPGKMNNNALYIMNKILYSGDCNISLLDIPQAQKAEIIIHDTSIRKNPNHAYLGDLAKAPQKIRAKTWLTHYMPNDLGILEENAKELGFAGVLKQGMEIEI